MIIVMEIQSGDTISTIVNSYENRNDAENKYHTILAAAAISSIPVHSAVMVTAEGYYVKSESYTHDQLEEQGES